jgi:SAM-dependent methyltransferase
VGRLLRGRAGPWDVGEPQPAIVRVAAAGGFTGPVLDAGCGPGDNTLHLAALGLRVLGVDVAGTAIESIEPDRVLTRFHDHGAPAWLVTVTRV